MANILCFVEQHAGELTPSSLETLGQARRVASTLGATVYAALAIQRAPGYGDDDVLAKLAAGGADKVLLLVGDAFTSGGGDATWESHGPAVVAAWDVSQPALLLVPSVGCGRELAARAAARVGAAYLHEAFVEIENDQLLLAEPRGTGTRRLPPDLDYPVVATIPPGRYAPALGDEEAEVEVLQVSPPQRFPSELVVELKSDVDGDGLVSRFANVKDSTIDLQTGKGNVRIALGPDAATADADFAVEGDAKQLIERLLSRKKSSEGNA